VLDAVPQEAKAPTLFSQILGLAKEKNVKITLINASNVSLFDAKGSTTPENQTPVSAATTPNTTIGQTPLGTGQTINKIDKASYAFSLKAQGSYEDLMAFAKRLTQINRIINIDSLSLSKDPKQNFLVLNISGRAYFLK
jgi:hypothetical protein